MKNLMKFLFVFLGVAIVTACHDDKDEDFTPTITNLEVGSGHGHGLHNNGTAYIGRDFHMAADILAPNKIEKIELIIHGEGAHQKNKGEEHDEWGHIVFYGYKGQINAKFHEHVDIPKTVKAGDYHFHFKVIDKKGLTTEVKRDLKIVEKPNKK